MKNRQLSKPALALLISGLLLTTSGPMLARYFHWPDFLQGFMLGLGLTLEVGALVKSRRVCRGVFARWEEGETK
ncbi:hypothetical protein HQ865_00330 [Mucilaginibacter mali]|uniref:Uncharacterized protein n=1 Tax=Mucilaginibacter mali TaxID=2740462 RepID=A0A7D4PRJ5_9SPHI|nr:hypothetical protein [Mucilaginibacter mali]QKJ28268.1 hypothetical protein HQ865_00330 [Mucilaginibacter mali]